MSRLRRCAVTPALWFLFSLGISTMFALASFAAFKQGFARGRSELDARRVRLSIAGQRVLDMTIAQLRAYDSISSGLHMLDHGFKLEVLDPMDPRLAQHVTRAEASGL